MQSNINISFEILDWVMARIKLIDLPEQIKQHLIEWRSGEKVPTYNQIEQTSKATGIPLGYFFLQKPPEEDLSLMNYRTVESLSLENPSRNLIDTIHDMKQIQQWTKEHLLFGGGSPLSFVGHFKSQQNPMAFASTIRKLLNLDDEWFIQSRTVDDSFRKIRSYISNIGVIVMMSGIVGNNTHRALKINEFRAFTLVDKYAPLIFINSNDSANAKLFSLLHEFAHICMGENSLFNDRDSTSLQVKQTETLCNFVAAEILVPQAVFTRKWHTTNDESKEQIILSLSNYFKCGTTVIARKALDNGLIEYPLYQKIAQLAVKHYNEMQKRKKDKSGGDYYTTAASRIDQHFFSMLLSSVSEGKTLYTDAFRLTNTNRSTFSVLAEKAGGEIR